MQPNSTSRKLPNPLSVMVKALFWTLSLLPLAINHALGSLLGWCFWIFPSKNKTNTLINLQLCFPDKTAQQRSELARKSLIESGKGITEAGWFWYRSPAALEKLIDIEDPHKLFGQLADKASKAQTKQPVDALNQQTPGTLYITPHFGSWEVITYVLSHQENPVYLYKPPRSPALESVIVSGRTRFGGSLAPASATGIRTLLKALKKGGSAGVLPDQEPDFGAGIFADFFHTPANTMTLINKLIQRTDARVVCLVVERKSSGKGYKVHCIEPHTDINHDDPAIAARAINETVERCVAINPTQYIWNYRRFRLMPDGSRRRYHKDQIRPASTSDQSDSSSI